MFARLIAVIFLWLPVSVALAASNTYPNVSDPVTSHSRAVMFGTAVELRKGLAFLGERGKRDAVAALIMALRFRRGFNRDITAVLHAITGHTAEHWRDWMIWQQSHEKIIPHNSFLGIKRDGLGRIDARYQVFFRTGWDRREDMRIRFGRVVWGGPRAMDGIPSLDYPKMIAANQADYMADSDLVFGIAINGDIRAYPLRIMGWHEMFNDVIGGVPVALAYCTLCGSGILFETKLANRQKPFVFGSSGLLYRSNKLMFDWETYSLWNQFTGEPVIGPLAKTGIRLKTRPVTITSWRQWRQEHPKSKILSLQTGHIRDYASGAVYRDYFASPDLMFPAQVRASKDFRAKDYIFGIRDFGVAKAWPVAIFDKMRVINDQIGERSIVLIGNSKTRTVRAYERNGQVFEALDANGLRAKSGEVWQLSEAFLTNSKGSRLARIAGVLSYWFAWDGYLGLRSKYYKAGD